MSAVVNNQRTIAWDVVDIFELSLTIIGEEKLNYRNYKNQWKFLMSYSIRTPAKHFNTLMDHHNGRALKAIQQCRPLIHQSNHGSLSCTNFSQVVAASSICAKVQSRSA